MINELEPLSQEINESKRILDLIHRCMAEGIRREVEYRRTHGLPIIVQRNGKIEGMCAELNDEANRKPGSP